MAEEKINVRCSGCQTVYEVDRDVLGERCKCVSCGNDFIIEEYISAADEVVPTTAVKMVRLTQKGMIPQVDDDKFKVSTVTKTTQTAIGITRGTRKYGNYKKKKAKKKSLLDILCFWKKK
jgi:hypothetical protein